MRRLNRRGLVRSFAVLALIAAVCLASLVSAPQSAQAQIGFGEYGLFQPHQPGIVGRAWCNADRTVEYWAYVVGEYRWPDASNGPGNRAQLAFERAGGMQYPSFEAFQAAVRAMPQFQGKALEFENHSVVRSFVQN